MGVEQFPSGTVTFLFSDIEGSTRLVQRLGDRYRATLEAHRDAMRECFVRHHGVEVGTEGDSFFVAFANASDGLGAALDSQRALAAHVWEDGAEVRVRIGLHTGAVELVGHDYVGLSVHEAARVASAAHGGQVVVSEATRTLADALPPGATLRDLGEHRLKDLESPKRLYQLCHPDLLDDFAPLRTLSVLPNNLPSHVTTFVGRQTELAEVHRLLDATRLLTLTGSGGTGKTRLALQAAADRLPGYRDGVWFVDLAPLTDPALVVSAVATALTLRPEQGQALAVAVVGFAATREFLLILDNCEHVVAACADLVKALVEAAPGVHILTTSRESLGVAGETTWRVPPLATPDPEHLPSLATLTQFEAVRLFIDRARQVQPQFSVTNETAPAVAQICFRLDGIPLAIELAAARVRVLSPDQIASRLDDRFKLLTGGARTALPRQQTLRALVDWSYELLDGPEQLLLRRLAVFPGDFSLEAAEAVAADAELDAADVLDVVTELVDRSMAMAGTTEDQARYRLFETIRAYARERLGATDEEPLLRQRHLAHFVHVAEQAAPHLSSPDHERWKKALSLDDDNMRAALSFALDSEATEEATRLVGALWKLWRDRGRWAEGVQAIERALALPGATPASRLEAMGGLMSLQERSEGAADASLMQAALEVARDTGDLRSQVNCLFGLGFAALHAGGANFGELVDEGVSLAEQLGDPGSMAAARMAQTMVAIVIDANLQKAGHFFAEGAEFAQASGDVDVIQDFAQLRVMLAPMLGLDVGSTPEGESSPRGASDVGARMQALSQTAMDALRRGDLDDAEQAAAELLVAANDSSSTMFRTTAWEHEAEVANHRGDTERARALLQQVLVASGDDSFAKQNTLRSLARVAVNAGDFDEATRLLDECWAAVRDLPIAPMAEVAIAAARARIAHRQGNVNDAHDFLMAAMARAEERGSAEAFGTPALLGLVQMSRGEFDQAARSLKQTISEVRQRGFRLSMVMSLADAARLLLRRGDPAFAARVLGAVDGYLADRGVVLTPYDRRAHDDVRLRLTEALGADACAAELAAGASTEMDAAVDEVLASLADMSAGI